jgi:RNA polymerase sigma factor (sigma-70 family)
MTYMAYCNACATAHSSNIRLFTAAVAYMAYCNACATAGGPSGHFPVRGSDAAAQMSNLDPPSMEEIHALTPYIHSVLKARGVPQRDRLDLVQRVLLGAWQAIISSRYRPIPGVPLRAWVGEIARRQASTYRRSARARQEELTDPDEIRHESQQTPPDERLAEEEERQIVAAQLQSTNPMRSILIAHDVDGVPMAEIAKEQRVPLSTAYRWRASALSALQKEARRRV